MTVKEDEVEFSNGKKGIYGIVEKPHFALIIPYFGDGFQLVKDYRYPIKGSYWEFPQGSHEETPEIDPLTLAKEELIEETGLIAGKINKIGFLFEASGYSNQGFHIFLATKLRKGKQSLEEGEEGMVSKKFSIEEFKKMILNGEIKDSSSVSAFEMFRIYKGI